MISFLLRAGLAALLLSSAIPKLLHLQRFSIVLRGFPIVGRGTSIPGGFAIASTELTVGAWLGLGIWWREAGLVAACLFAVLSVGYVLLRAGGASGTNCGCGGMMPEGLPPMLHLSLNVALFALSLVIMISGKSVFAIPIAGPLGGSVEKPSEMSYLVLLVLAMFALHSMALRSVVSLRLAR